MILQYFKIKENEYKKTADKIYIYILQKSKKIINDGFLNNVDFNSSFEIISIIIIFYINLFKQNQNINNKKINDELIKNFINDIDRSMRDIGIGDMSIGKNVKKYVKKFYFRVKTIDKILNDLNQSDLIDYLNTLNITEKNKTSLLSAELIEIYSDLRDHNFY